MEGWIKLHRQLMQKAFYSKDSQRIHLWIHIHMKANHSEKEEMLNNKPFVCKPGQFTTGRKQLALETGINESKIERILTYFEKTEQQIEQLKTSRNRLITIVSWAVLQQSEQQNEQQVNNSRTTGEQQVNTLKEVKNIKNIKNDKNKLFIRESEFKNGVFSFKNEYPEKMLFEFFDYWSEPNKSKTKMKFEMQNTWDLSRRLKTWHKRSFNSHSVKKESKLDEAHNNYNEARHLLNIKS